MRFKWVKRCSKLSVSFLLTIGFAFAWMNPSHATIFMTPDAASGSLSNAVQSGGTINYLAFYSSNYPTSNIIGNAFFRFTPLKVDQDMVRIQITSTNQISLTAGQVAVITFYSYPNTGSPHQAPIAEYNYTPCVDSNGNYQNINCVALNWGKGYGQTVDTAVSVPASVGANKYFGAIYPGTGAQVTIGFKLSDICATANAAGVALNNNVCNSSNVSLPGTNPFWNFQLSFSIVGATNANPTYNIYPTGQAFDSTSSYVNFSFQSAPSTFTCPDTNTLNSNFTPGDGRIFLDTTLFGVTPPAGGGASLGRLTLVGKKIQNGVQPNQSPVLNSTFSSPGVNDLIANAPLGNIKSQISGFQNSTEGNPISYNVGFVAQDYTGTFISPAPNTCYMGPVQTAEILQFLPPNNKNCFIATAAFRSPDSPPVVLLRAFRDQVLLNYSVGKNFVNWYYRWSPDAAEWLNEHPIFRFPVLLLLFPIEGIAWFSLHPMEFVIFLGLAGVCGLFLGRVALARRREGR